MNSRREFFKYASLGLGGLFFANTYNSFSSLGLEEEQAHRQERKLGIALVGLGMYSEGQLAPALQHTKNCRLSGIVTGTPSKAEKWKKQYNIPDKNIYNYQNFDTIKDNPDIDIVYVVLPNAMHAEYVIRAAKAGKHVICEKPMGVSVKECEQMIRACKEAKRMLSVGYRLHFEPYNREMMRLGKEKEFGNIQLLKAENGMHVPPNTWRTDKELAGGGPLMDVGIYCVQGVIYTTGELPVSVTAQEGKKNDAEKFKEVEESIYWKFEFPSGAIAECSTSYSSPMNSLRAEAERGKFELSPAYQYGGLKGRTSVQEMSFPQVNQQALQMDDFANCINTNQRTRVPGEMGLRDVRILQAIYESARTGKKVPLNFEDIYAERSFSER